MKTLAFSITFVLETSNILLWFDKVGCHQPTFLLAGVFLW